MKKGEGNIVQQGRLVLVDALRIFTMFWIVARDTIFRANWILLFMFSIVLCHIAGAQTTYYVSTEGNDDNELITGKRTEQVIQDEVVYQNPVTNGILKIGMTSKAEGFLSIYSIVGECVYKQNLSGSDSTIIQVGAWKKGLYLLNFTSGNKSISRKVIIR